MSNETDEDEEEIEVYEFVATGEHTCERCMALNGSQWAEPPSPPHAHCECEIVPKLINVHRARDCSDNTWTMEPVGNGEGTVRYGPGGLGGFEWGFTVTIDCWDGGVHEFEIWVDMGSESDYPDAYSDTMDATLSAFAWSEVYDEAEAIAAQVCRPCSPPLVS